MKALIHAAIAASILVGPAVSFAQSVTSAPVSNDSAKTFDVFVDQPTGYTFVKLPSGWKFVGAVSKDDAQHLPGTVLTSVLPAGTSQQASTGTIVRQ
jgi:hypothetical protein